MPEVSTLKAIKLIWKYIHWVIMSEGKNILSNFHSIKETQRGYFINRQFECSVDRLYTLKKFFLSLIKYFMCLSSLSRCNLLVWKLFYFIFYFILFYSYSIDYFAYGFRSQTFPHSPLAGCVLRLFLVLSWEWPTRCFAPHHSRSKLGIMRL